MDWNEKTLDLSRKVAQVCGLIGGECHFDMVPIRIVNVDLAQFKARDNRDSVSDIPFLQVRKKNLLTH